MSPAVVIHARYDRSVPGDHQTGDISACGANSSLSEADNMRPFVYRGQTSRAAGNNAPLSYTVSTRTTDSRVWPAVVTAAGRAGIATVSSHPSSPRPTAPHTGRQPPTHRHKHTHKHTHTHTHTHRRAFLGECLGNVGNGGFSCLPMSARSRTRRTQRHWLAGRLVYQRC